MWVEGSDVAAFPATPQWLVTETLSPCGSRTPPTVLTARGVEPRTSEPSRLATILEPTSERALLALPALSRSGLAALIAMREGRGAGGDPGLVGGCFRYPGRLLMRLAHGPDPPHLAWSLAHHHWAFPHDWRLKQVNRESPAACCCRCPVSSGPYQAANRHA